VNIRQKKAKAKSAKPVDKAVPVIRKRKNTDLHKISIVRSITSAMKAAPQWPASAALQAAAVAWNADADALESNAKTIADTRMKLAALESAQRAHRQKWRASTRQMIGIVTVVAEGSPDAVQTLGFDVRPHVAAVPQTSAPGGIVSMPGEAAGEAIVTWQRGIARHGFLVQRATDPADPTTYSVPVPCTKTKYKTDGEKPETLAHFRVTAIDPTSASGIGPWSDWVASTVG
jgi:hypothetical protein